MHASVIAVAILMTAQANAHARILVDASSAQPGQEVWRAMDNNDTTAWCAAEEAPSKAKVNLSKTLFGKDEYDDWWEMEFENSAQTIGAISMKSGMFKNGRIVGHKIRDFVWAFQRWGEEEWHKIPETDLYANRAQLIFRFDPIWRIHKLRLFIRPREREEKKIFGSNAPCLREVRVYPDRNAEIPVRPWFYAVATWEEGNKYDPLEHWGHVSFRVEEAVRSALAEITGFDAPTDVTDEMWIAEFNPTTSKERKSYSHWIMHEPAPSGFLLSGNYKDYDSVDASNYFGFYNFMRTRFVDTPVLGACGGHQLIAMAMTHSSYDSFTTEFTPDRIDQTVVTCSTNPSYGCGSRSAKDCCYEGGSPNPFRYVSPNVNGLAMPNAFMTTRFDMLFNLLQNSGPEGFRAFLYHEDYVNPLNIASAFNVIATYPASVANTDAAHPSLVQAMKLKGFPVYGSQFHWDENETGSCSRDEGNRNMERILKNFVLIALNRLSESGSLYQVTASENEDSVRNAFDLDRNTAWCGKSLTMNFSKIIPIRYIMMVEEQNTRFQSSSNGIDWSDIEASRTSLFDQQQSCDQRPGGDDGETYLYTTAAPLRTKYLRMNWDNSSACTREIFVLKGL